MIAATLGLSLGQSLVGSLTGNTATDKARQTRESWTLQMAQQGSPTAAAIIVAAPRNVSGNEASGWKPEAAQIPASVLAAASAMYGASGWWPSGQPDFFTDVSGPTHSRIVAEVAAAAGSIKPATAPPLTIPVRTTSTTGLTTGTGVGAISGQNAPPAPYVPASPSPAVQLPTTYTTAQAPTSKLPWILAGLGLVVVLFFVVRRRHG